MSGIMGGSFDASGSFVSFLVPTLLALTSHSLFNDKALLEEMTRFQGFFIFPIFSLRMRLLFFLISLSLGAI